MTVGGREPSLNWQRYEDVEAKYPTFVYNIEVHNTHVYHVATSGVVVHNHREIAERTSCRSPNLFRAAITKRSLVALKVWRSFS